MPSTFIRLFTLLVVAAGFAGCLDDSVGQPRDLGVSIESVQSVVQLGDSAVVEISAQGQHLAELTLSWGDGTVEELDPMGAVELERRNTHTYDEPGLFEPHVRAVEISGRAAEASTSVEVTTP